MRRPLSFRCALRALIIASSGALLGCIVDAPDTLEEPRTLGPWAYIDRADPTVLRQVETSSLGPPRVFRASFASEDLGEPVVGMLFLNDLRESEESGIVIGVAERAGSTLYKENGEINVREIEVPWERPSSSTTPGCYRITLVLAHASNFNNARLPKPIDSNKAAYIIWWAFHNAEAQDVTLEDCIPKNLGTGP